MDRLAHHVVKLDISNICSDPPDFFSSIASLSALTYLRLHQQQYNQADAGNAAPLVGLSQLRALEVEALDALRNVGQGHFAALQHLQDIKVSHCGPNALHPFSGNACLRSACLHDFSAFDLPAQLHLDALTSLRLQTIALVFGDPACLTTLTSLQVLHVFNVTICSEIGINALSSALGEISSLTELWLDKVVYGSGQRCLDISQLQKLVHLQGLFIRSCALSNGVKIPHSCTRLTGLCLTANSLTCVPIIPTSPALVQVSLTKQLSNFQLDQTFSTFLQNAPNLEHLDLRQLPLHKWTFDSIVHISKSTCMQAPGRVISYL